MFVVAFMLLTQLLSDSVFAAIEGETIGGKTGNLKIFYDLSIAKTSAYASTTAKLYDPNPNLSTYV